MSTTIKHFPQLTLKKPFCPVCQASGNGKFCSSCGSDLIEGMRSCECGYGNIWPHEKFCQECGIPASELPKKEALSVRTAN